MTTLLDTGRVADLADRVSGRVLRPEDDGYDAARAVHNGLIDRRPALIVGCRTTADVVEALALRARRRAGGVGARRRPQRRRPRRHRRRPDDRPRRDEGRRGRPRRARPATAEGGATWAELNDAAGEHGLAVTGGAVSTTGIAGYTLGGGLGWLMAKHGLASDNLLAVELVTADGDRPRRQRRVGPATSSGRCAAAAATSASRRRSPTACTRSDGHRRADRPPVRRRAGPAALLSRRRRRRLGRPDGVRRTRARARRIGREARGARRLPHRRPRAAERDLAPFKTWGSPLVVDVGPMPYPVMNTILDGGFPKGRSTTGCRASRAA